jgi:hypothetical protein
MNLSPKGQWNGAKSSTVPSGRIILVAIIPARCAGLISGCPFGTQLPAATDGEKAGTLREVPFADAVARNHPADGGVKRSQLRRDILQRVCLEDIFNLWM